jgi:hypothetical protein
LYKYPKKVLRVNLSQNIIKTLHLSTKHFNETNP